jgi:hypothetical protein
MTHLNDTPVFENNEKDWVDIFLTLQKKTQINVLLSPLDFDTIIKIKVTMAYTF